MQTADYVLFGQSVSNSLSPLIYKNFAQQFNLKFNYKTVNTIPSEFINTLWYFRSRGLLGANISAPFKECAYGLCDYTDEDAKRSLAVNTLYWDHNNKLHGANTDGLGLISDLKFLNIKPKNILILGSGGAAASIIPALMNYGAHKIYLTNRDQARALDLQSRFKNYDIQLLTFPPDPEFSQDWDFVINTCSANFISLDAKIINNKIFYDLNYDFNYAKIKPTLFMQWAQKNGASLVFDGTGMLIEQAAQAFYLWYQLRPCTQITRKLLCPL